MWKAAPKSRHFRIAHAQIWNVSMGTKFTLTAVSKLKQRCDLLSAVALRTVCIMEKMDDRNPVHTCQQGKRQEKCIYCERTFTTIIFVLFFFFNCKH